MGRRLVSAHRRGRRARSKIAVHFYLEDGFLVRGTLDPVTALGWAVAEDDDFELRYSAAEMACRNDSGDEPEPDQVAELADLCHELIRTAQPGLYRINVAPPDHWDGYAWFTGRVKNRGPGVFEGVEFR